MYRFMKENFIHIAPPRQQPVWKYWEVVSATVTVSTIITRAKGKEKLLFYSFWEYLFYKQITTFSIEKYN